MNIREAAQMALDALTYIYTETTADEDKLIHASIEALRAALANEFNPDWDAMAVMVEEQQRMAKRIEELESALAQPEPPIIEEWYLFYGGHGNFFVNDKFLPNVRFTFDPDTKMPIKVELI